MTKTLLVATAALFAMAGVAAAQPADGIPSGEQIVQAWDTDHDGGVSQAEWTAAGRPAESFAVVDADHDGKVSAAELDTAITAMRARMAAQQGGGAAAPPAAPASGQ